MSSARHSSVARAPLQWLAEQEQAGHLTLDAAQRQAITRLDALYQQLMIFRHKRHRWLGKWLPLPELPRGVYFWGGVGRGKSMLMDAFYAGLPYRRKARLHFHEFMRDVHERLAALKGETDPLLAVADQIATAYRVLCFDEFHVNDIADAMLLGRLLSALFSRGLVLVVTSNYPPSGLYPDGLQRQNFLPAIALLEQHLDVLNVDAGVDYRRAHLLNLHAYHYPENEATQAKMEQIFADWSAGHEILAPDFKILGRTLHAKKRCKQAIWFDFEALCAGPRSQQDYLELALQHELMMVSGLPQLGPAQAQEARRFTWLIDILYDQKVKLVISAAAAPEQIYTQGVLAGEFVRTASRLHEMQSQQYLEQPRRSKAGSV